MLGQVPGIDQIISKGEVLPNFDYQCPLMSLPLAFKTELHSIPSAPQLTIDGDSAKQWKNKLGDKIKPRVGLVWSGSTIHTNDHNRSLSLAQLLPHLPPNIEYVCLQKEVRLADQALLEQRDDIQYFGDELNDFMDTAALCSLMDIVISVDTSVAHLSATLGKPTWVLLPFSPDWRWLLNRDDSPWYPSATLYRQEKVGQWSTTLERIEMDLGRLSIKHKH